MQWPVRLILLFFPSNQQSRSQKSNSFIWLLLRLWSGGIRIANSRGIGFQEWLCVPYINQDSKAKKNNNNYSRKWLDSIIPVHIMEHNGIDGSEGREIGNNKIITTSKLSLSLKPTLHQIHYYEILEYTGLLTLRASHNR